MPLNYNLSLSKQNLQEKIIHQKKKHPIRAKTLLHDTVNQVTLRRALLLVRHAIYFETEYDDDVAVEKRRHDAYRNRDAGAPLKRGGSAAFPETRLNVRRKHRSRLSEGDARATKMTS